MQVPETDPVSDTVAHRLLDATALVPALSLSPEVLSVRADEDPANVYLARLAAGASRTTMAAAIGVIAKELGVHVKKVPWAQLRYQHTQALRTRLAQKFAPATANKILAALRGVLRESMRLGQMRADDYTRAVDITAVRGSRLPAGRALSGGEIRALFGACDSSTITGCRDAALLAILYGGGLRRAEAVALNVDDYDEATGALKVLGKGNKARIALYATNGTAEALAAWLDVRGRDDGPLFYPVNKGARIEKRRLSPHAVLLILHRATVRAGVARTSPHSLRRTFGLAPVPWTPSKARNGLIKVDHGHETEAADVHA